MHQWDSEPASTHQTLWDLVNRVVPGDVETGIVLLERGGKVGKFCRIWCESELDFQPGLNQCWAYRDRKTDPKRTTNVYQSHKNNTLRCWEVAFVTKGFCHSSYTQNHTQRSLHWHQSRNCKWHILKNYNNTLKKMTYGMDEHKKMVYNYL